MTSDLFAVLVLDRSGSMASIWEATVAAFENWVNDQKDLDGAKAWATWVVFDDQIDVLYDAWGMGDLPSLRTRPDVMPRGMTALYDAIAAGLKRGDEWLAGKGDWFEGTKECVIVTDGYENHSRTEDRDSIFAKIRAHEADGWTFVYLGANQDAWQVASGMGITTRGTTQTYDYSAAGASASIATASTGTSNLRQTGTYQAPDPDPSSTSTSYDTPQNT